MKRLLILIAFFAANLLFADGLPNAPYVYAVGYASRTIEADLVRLSFSLEHRSLDSAKASAAVEEKTRHVFSILEKFGVTSKDITAAEITTDLKYDEDTGKEFLGYVVERRFELLVRDVSQYGILVKSLLDAAVDRLFLRSISSTKEESLGRELEKEARISAREKADEAAANFSAEVIGIYAISPRSFLQLGSHLLNDDRSSGTSAMASFNAGSSSITFVLPPLKIQREAHAIFLIKNKAKTD